MHQSDQYYRDSNYMIENLYINEINTINKGRLGNTNPILMIVPWGKLSGNIFSLIT